MTTSKPDSIFCSAPNPGDEGMKYTIIRTGPKGIKGPIITSHDPLGLYTHWAGGRTLPCVRHDCEQCEQNAARRWYGYLMVYSLKQDRQYLFEYTAAAAETVVRYFAKHRTLRGAQLIGERAGARANGRLTLYLHTPKAENDPLPKAPNRVALLSQMWSVPLESFLEKQPPAVEAADTSITAIRSEPRDANVE